jgi:predicted phosphodiesterase
MSTLRIIGDVHGRIPAYCKLANKSDMSVCVGDVGFHYDDITLDPVNHKIIAGNHDNYSQEDGKFYKQTKHFLGDFGFVCMDRDFYYVRGGCSIDAKRRTIGVDYWPEEELTVGQGMACIELYEQLKPSIVITHECPTDLSRMIGNPEILRDYGFAHNWTSKTAQLLQAMFDIHKPALWIFGHHHRSIKKSIDGCEFVCLPELGYIDI